MLNGTGYNNYAVIHNITKIHVPVYMYMST